MTNNTSENLPFMVADSPPPGAVIKVVGVGGCGCNSVSYMFQQGTQGVETYCVNTDIQALENNLESCTQILQIGSKITGGLGAGAKAKIGYAAALEDKSRIAGVLQGADLLFIVAGMGGGTGTGASPLLAEIAKNLNILTIAVVTEPFQFERRDKVAKSGIERLKPNVDSIITLSNNMLLEKNKGQRKSVRECFESSNHVLFEAVSGISDLITQQGMVNVDFADLRSIMKESGRAIIGIGEAEGAQRARYATDHAVQNPLNDDVVSSNVQRLLINIASSEEVPITLEDYQVINQIIDKSFGSHEAKKVIGNTIEPSLGGKIKVTVIATAFKAQQHALAAPQQSAPEREPAQHYGAAQVPQPGAPVITQGGQSAVPVAVPASGGQDKVFEFTDWNGGHSR